MRAAMAGSFLLIILLASCDLAGTVQGGNAAPNRYSKSITIEEKTGSSLASRSVEAPFVSDTSAGAGIPAAGRAAAKAPVPVTEYGFSWLFAVSSPTIGGHVVQATDLAVLGDLVYVAYNDSGEPFNGAIQVIDPSGLTASGKKVSGSATIQKLIAFEGMDIHALYPDPVGKRLYFAGAADPDKFGGVRAFVGWLDPSDLSSAAIASSVRSLSSHAAVSLVRDGKEILVASGAASGVISHLTTDLQPVSEEAAVDVRSVDRGALQGNAFLAAALKGGAAGGEGALMLRNSTTAWSTIPLPWFKAPEAKAAVKVIRPSRFVGKHDGLIGAALSDQGFHLWNVRGDSVDSLFGLPNPGGSTVNTANSVAWSGDVNDHLVFLANGEYGLRVVALDSLPTNASSKKDWLSPFAHVVGVLQVPEEAGVAKASFNAVHYSPPLLMAAAGRQGVQFYWMF